MLQRACNPTSSLFFSCPDFSPPILTCPVPLRQRRTPRQTHGFLVLMAITSVGEAAQRALAELQERAWSTNTWLTAPSLGRAFWLDRGPGRKRRSTSDVPGQKIERPDRGAIEAIVADGGDAAARPGDRRAVHVLPDPRPDGPRLDLAAHHHARHRPRDGAGEEATFVGWAKTRLRRVHATLLCPRLCARSSQSIAPYVRKHGLLRRLRSSQ